MALFREDEQVVLLVGGGEGDEQTGSVPEVDVLIDHAVDEEEPALELRGVGEDRAVVVALGVGLGRAHVALGVTRVVAVPVGHWRAGDADLEDLRGAQHGHAGHVAAVAPAVDADPRAIHIGQGSHVAHAGHLVVDLDRAHAVGQGGFEGQPAVGAAAVIEPEDHVALLRQVLGAQVHREHPVVSDALGVRPTVDGDDERVAAPGFEDRWAVDGAVKERAIGGGEGGELRSLQAERGGLGAFVGEDVRNAGASRVPHGDARAVFEAAPGIDEAVALRGEDGSVPAPLAGEAHDFAAVERDAVEVAFKDRVSRANEVRDPEFFINAHQAGDHPLAAGELADAAAIGGVKVEMAEAGFLAEPGDAAIGEELGIAVEVDPRLAVLLDERGGGSGRIKQVEAKGSLVA